MGGQASRGLVRPHQPHVLLERAPGAIAGTPPQLTPASWRCLPGAGLEPGVCEAGGGGGSDVQTYLTRARTWAPVGRPIQGAGVCFGPEVTWVLGRGQLGLYTASIPGSWTPAPNTVLLASGTFIPGRRGSRGTFCLPNRLRPCPTLWQSQVTPVPPGPQAARASLHPTDRLSVRSSVRFTLG